MQVKYYDSETFVSIDGFQVVDNTTLVGDDHFIGSTIIRLIGIDIPQNNSGFDIYADDGETVILYAQGHQVAYDTRDGYIEYTSDANVYCIYYLYNEDGYITGQYRAIEGVVVENGVLIKTGQGKEFVEDIKIEFVDSDKLYNFKLVDGEIIEVTEDEKATIKATQKAASFGDNKESKIVESKLLLASYLETHPLISNCHGGVEAAYTVTSEKQALMSSNYLTYTIAKQVGASPALTWNAVGCECEVWTEEEYLTLVLQVSEYVKPLVSKQQMYEVQIKACTNQEELDAIELVYE